MRHTNPLENRPYWWDTTLAPGRNPPASGSFEAGRQFDVAVVGGGYTGLAAARQLARRGASVIVLERAAIGAGASSRNAGQLLTGLKLEPAALVAKYGEVRAKELFDVSRQAMAELEQLVDAERIDCELRDRLQFGIATALATPVICSSCETGARTRDESLKAD